AALAVIGCSVGTTSTAFLGSLNAATATKRVAITNVVYNVFAATVAVITLPLYRTLFERIWGASFDPVLGIALFFTAFNVVGVLLFVPLIGPFGKLVERLAPERTTQRTRFIANISPDVPEAAVPGLVQELKALLRGVIDLHRRVLGMSPTTARSRLPWRGEVGVTERYNELKLLQAEIMRFGSQVEQHGLGRNVAAGFDHTMHAAR